MTAFLVAALWCDLCAAIRGNDAALDDVDELRRRATDDGWSRVPGYADDIDLCSSCTEDRAEATS